MYPSSMWPAPEGLTPPEEFRLEDVATATIGLEESLVQLHLPAGCLVVQGHWYHTENCGLKGFCTNPGGCLKNHINVQWFSGWTIVYL